jgi:hypothetical protein
VRLGFVWCRGTERIFQVLPIAAAALVIAPNTFVTAEEFISLDQMLSKDQQQARPEVCSRDPPSALQGQLNPRRLPTYRSQQKAVSGLLVDAGQAAACTSIALFVTSAHLKVPGASSPLAASNGCQCNRLGACLVVRFVDRTAAIFLTT